MSGADRVRSTAEEPAAHGGTAVPDIAAWQEAADRGAAARVQAGPAQADSAQAHPIQADPAPGGVAATDRPGGPPWIPASAALPAAMRSAVIAWLRAALPNEGCGLLVADRVAGDGGLPTRFVGMANAAASPYRYLIDPQEQLRVWLEVDDADEVVWAIVHSHVASPARPSATDVGLAAYPEALYIICSMAAEPPDLRAWTIVDDAVNEVVLEPV